MTVFKTAERVGEVTAAAMRLFVRSWITAQRTISHGFAVIMCFQGVFRRISRFPSEWTSHCITQITVFWKGTTCLPVYQIRVRKVK